MSTLNVEAISHPTSGSLVTINGTAPSNRNKIINGDMRIDQRNAGASVTYAGRVYTADRFSCEKSDLSTLVATNQQVFDGPPGFDKSIKTTITTAQSSTSNSKIVGCDQRIEGYNWADMAFGTASAKSFTMSFWVKSSVTGTYPVSFFNAGVNRAYLATYSISAANTWEYKTITVTGDTTGTWNTTNGIGLGFQMSLGGGSSTEGTAGSWESTYKSRTSACVNLNETLNATWQITGVQLEVGSVATPFEHRSYGDELARCQRYYQLFDSAAGEAYPSGGVGAYAICGVNFIQTMRAAPTVILGTAGTSSNISGDNFTLTTPTAIGCVYRVVQGAGGGNYYRQRTSNTASAEL